MEKIILIKLRNLFLQAFPDDWSLRKEGAKYPIIIGEIWGSRKATLNPSPSADIKTKSHSMRLAYLK